MCCWTSGVWIDWAACVSCARFDVLVMIELSYAELLAMAVVSSVMMKSEIVVLA